MADTFSIHDTDGKQIFHATEDYSRISAHTLKIKGMHGFSLLALARERALLKCVRLAIASTTFLTKQNDCDRLGISYLTGIGSISAHSLMKLFRGDLSSSTKHVAEGLDRQILSKESA